jgi:ribonucleotide monophosphatase NagD (HAD superfamily)
MDLEKIFNENEAFFKKLKPKNLTCRKSEKFNIWIVTNSSSKQKDKYLNKLQKYLKK